MATRVFLLSADEKAVHVITQILDEQDIRFEHSSDTTFTLKRLAGQHFDILVVDCDNAESAMQVFNSARASSLNRGAIAIAIVEGKAGVPNAFRLGASLVLTKPVSLDQSRNTLRTAVGMTKKDPLEARPVVVPATPSFSVVPSHMPPATHPPTPMPAASSVPVAAAPAPPLPVAPVNIPVAVTPTVPPVITPVAPTPLALPVPSVAIPVVPTVQPIVPKPADLTPAAKKDAISVPSAALAAHESTPADKASSMAIAPKTKPSLQLSETRVLKAEEEFAPVPEPDKPAPLSIEKSTVSLSSAMLGSSESEAAIDKLETELTKPEPELKTASPAEMFAPAVKEAVEPKLDEVSGEPEDSAATLRASAIPAFGGLSKQPFAGIEPTNNGKRGLIIGGLVVGLAAAGFAGAWFYAPGFRKAVQWEYARIYGQIHPAPAQSAVAVNRPVQQPVANSVLMTDQVAPTNAAAAASTSSSAATPNTTIPSSTATAAPVAVPTPAAVPAPMAQTSKSPSAVPPNNPPSTASLVNTSASATSIPASKPSDLFEVPEDYADDQVIHRVHPAYPKAARVRKLEGAVVLQAIIDKQGKVDSLQLVSGDPLLAQAAADAVKQWRYKPYSHNGDPVEFQTRVTVDFKLPLP